MGDGHEITASLSREGHKKIRLFLEESHEITWGGRIMKSLLGDDHDITLEECQKITYHMVPFFTIFFLVFIIFPSGVPLDPLVNNNDMLTRFLKCMRGRVTKSHPFWKRGWWIYRRYFAHNCGPPPTANNECSLKVIYHECNARIICVFTSNWVI